MNQQFWSFDEIVEVATSNCPEGSAGNTEYDISKFKATVADTVLKAARDGRIARIKANKRGVLFDPDNPNHEMLANLGRGAFPLAMLAFFYLLAEMAPDGFLKEGISPVKAAFVTVTLPLGFFFLVPPFISIWFTLQSRRAKTPGAKLKHTMNLADFHGAREDLYDSDNAICFLNQQFKLNIPRDPFRAWSDPFFRRNGDIWIVGFEGKQVLLRSDKKTQDRNERIAHLLRAPFKDFPCEQLVSKGLPETDMPLHEKDVDDGFSQLKSNIGERGLTLSQVEAAAKELQARVERAQSEGNIELLDELKGQHQHLTRYLEESRKGKPDRSAGIRARDSLKKNKEALVKDVLGRNPELGEHLKNYINFSGTSVSYRPPDDVTWDIEF
ncbi:hypothetical protein DESUT3_01380 [Desulfuromonas versatilis]|uniref:Uncharacterized protein n=2 Tax=Desulfuromonas versatilis TaxID=2802975 RepID=A0ABN6DU75_9BACT|nr:hypothetical protein DESUT3_01380 [Desulfuromonas versatilis]